MTSMQKALKAFSLISIIAGLDLLVTFFVLAASDQIPPLLNSLLMGLTSIGSIVVGGLGVFAANVPARTVRMLPVALVVLVINVINLAACCMANVAVISAVMNALFVVVVAYCARAVMRAYLD